MEFIVWTYIVTLSLLILHEIESAYWKEWEILKLPGGLKGFILLHLPLISFFLYGLLKLYDGAFVGVVISCILGISGIIPFLVHNIFVKRKGKFDQDISQFIIYASLIAGIFLIILSLSKLFHF